MGKHIIESEALQSTVRVLVVAVSHRAAHAIGSHVIHAALPSRLLRLSQPQQCLYLLQHVENAPVVKVGWEEWQNA